jgi:hypothetical protein
MDSVASNRDEQYPQLKPYRFPPPERVKPAPVIGREVFEEISELAFAETAATAAAGCGCGTRSVVRHVGQRTSCPTCTSSAERLVRQTWQGNTSIVSVQS